MTRPSLEAIMLQVAQVIAQRATCVKLSVGCVLLDYRGVIVGTGYNGVPRGCVHCTDFPCPGSKAPKGADLCRAVHAEQNALLCPESSKAITCLVTHAPCLRCTKLLLNTNVQTIIFAHGYDIEPAAPDLWRSMGRKWVRFELLRHSEAESDRL